MPNAELRSFVVATGPVVTAAALKERFTKETVRWAVRRGDLERVGHGRYRLPYPAAEATEDVRQQALVARRVGGVLGQFSAAQAWGLPLWRPPDEVVVVVPRGSRARHHAGVRLIRRPISPSEWADGRTGLLRTVLDCAAPLRPARHSRWSIRQCGSALRALALEAGRAVRPQVWIGPTTAARARVDLADVGRRVAIEADGHQHHSSRADWRRDLRRSAEFTASGWVVLRFTWEDARRRPGWVRSVMARVRTDRGPVRDLTPG